MNLTLGIEPPELRCEIAADELRLKSYSQYPFAGLQLTLSFEDEHGEYLDFQEIDLPELPAGEERSHVLELEPPEHAVAATIDISGTEQTFLKRHWKLISTVAALTWGVILVARRLDL